CGARQSGNLGSSEDALDGIFGFGKSNSSIISQLSSSGKVKKMFAHCLDGDNGGGIFAIGHVVQPKVNSTPLIPDEPHYAANVTGISVGAQFLNLSSNTSGSGEIRRTIIDSGTTLAYLPDAIYRPLVKEEDSLCFGWQNYGMDSLSTMDTILLGDLVLSNKLVLYDLENQTIGWTEYNCSSSIKLRDEITGSVHLVGPHSISSAGTSIHRTYLTLLLVIALLHYMMS
ncbi:aspartic proteinase-like protein 2 isoform X1, partial [Tanacetum coccineum]